MKNDNIIRVAQDLDKSRKYALSNELLNLFSDMSSVATQEEYNEVKSRYDDFMVRVKEADSDIHDRLMKTAAFRWWDRLGDWFSGSFKGQDARENRIRQRVTNQPAGSLGIAPGANPQEVYKAVLGQFTEGLEGKVNSLSQTVGQFSEQMAGMEQQARTISQQASDMMNEINTKVGYLKSQNRNDADVGLLIDSMAKPLLQDLKQVAEKGTSPKFDGTYASSMGQLGQILPKRYQDILAKGGQASQNAGNTPPDGDTSTDSTSADGTPQPPDGSGSGGLPPVVEPEGWRVQSPDGREGFYNSTNGQVAWEDGEIDMNPITPEQAEAMRSKAPQQGQLGGAPQQGQLGAGNPQQEGLVPATQPQGNMATQPVNVSPEAQTEAQRLMGLINSQDPSTASESQQLILNLSSPNPQVAALARETALALKQQGVDFVPPKQQHLLNSAPTTPGAVVPAETDSKKNVLSQAK